MFITAIQERRLWDRVDRVSSVHGCWLWIRKVGTNRYPTIQLNHKHIVVHRVVWMLANGPIPKGKNVLHNCPGGDNPRCCNPDHLWLGTQKQNMEDKVKKGRQAKGAKNGRAKLTAEDVAYIRRTYARGELSGYELADLYSISNVQVYRIIHRLKWR